jgi:hypothetical protein
MGAVNQLSDPRTYKYVRYVLMSIFLRRKREEKKDTLVVS